MEGDPSRLLEPCVEVHGSGYIMVSCAKGLGGNGIDCKNSGFIILVGVYCMPLTTSLLIIAHSLGGHIMPTDCLPGAKS